MPLYDFECENCGNLFEEFTDPDIWELPCPECEAAAKKLMSIGRINCANQDAAWLRTIPEVIEKGTGKPHCERAIKDPTRDNVEMWMNGEGLRPLEPGEERAFRKPTEKEDQADTFRKADLLLKRFKERRAISVNDRANNPRA